MAKVRIILTVLVLGLVVGASVVAAAPAKPVTSVPNSCGSTRAKYYNANLFPVYEYRNQRLVLKDWTNKQIERELDSGLLTSSLQFSTWSNDCRYLTGVVGKGTEKTLMIWDTVNGQRAGSFSIAGIPTPILYWKPDGEKIVVASSKGTYLWTLASNLQIDLKQSYDRYQVQWDQRNRQILLLPKYRGEQPPGVSVYNEDSGEKVAYLDNPAGVKDLALGFRFMGRSRIAVFTTVSGVANGAGVTVWDSKSLTNVQISAGTDGVSASGRIAISPDGHYLAIVRRTVRVWDLTTLAPEVKDRTPVNIFNSPDFTVNSINFLDNVTLELTGKTGVARMDVTNGNMLPVS